MGRRDALRVALLGGCGARGGAGGLAGALVGHGLPEADARGYEESVRQGSVLLSVHAANARQGQEARGIFERVGGSDARVYRAPAR